MRPLGRSAEMSGGLMGRFYVVAAMAILPSIAGFAAVSEKHPILGLWRLNRSCPETYEFKANGTRSATSAAQTLQSTFEISAQPNAKGFYAFTDTVVQTNGLPDCAGEITPVGDVVKLYIRFSEQSKFYLCFAQSQDRCVGPFERIFEHAP
jgi:hypothetical protein